LGEFKEVGHLVTSLGPDISQIIRSDRGYLCSFAKYPD